MTGRLGAGEQRWNGWTLTQPQREDWGLTGPVHDHRVLYTLETFTPLEGWNGVITPHRRDWSPEGGPVYRRNLLLEVVRPCG